MVRTLSAALVAIVVSATCMTAAHAQFPVQPTEQNGAVTHEEILAYLKQIDPNVQVVETPEGKMYLFNVRGKDNFVLPMVVVVNNQGIAIGAQLSKPVDTYKVSLDKQTKMKNLVGRNGTRFGFIDLGQGKVGLFGGYGLPRNANLRDLDQGFLRLMGDLAETAPIWAPVVQDLV